MSDRNLSLEVKYDPLKDLMFGISGMCIFAFFIPASISLFLIFIGQAEAGEWILGLTKDFGVTISQISLAGAIIFLLIGLFGIYFLHLVATGKKQKVITSEE